MFVRLAQPEDTHNIVHLTRELAQVLVQCVLQPV